MPKQLTSQFTRYSFTEEELPAAHIFTDMQIAHIRNEMALIAERKIALVYSEGQQFLQDEAMLAGQLQILQYLLDTSEATESSVLDQIAAETQSQ